MSLEARDPDAGVSGWGGGARSGGGAPQAGSGGSFHVAIAPRVDSVDVGTSGLGGGGAVTIAGGGFSNAPGGNTVELPGGGAAWVPCAVTAASGTSITCTPGAASGGTPLGSGAEPLAGAAGLLHSVWFLGGGGGAPARAEAADWAASPCPLGAPPNRTFLSLDAVSDWISPAEVPPEGPAYAQMLRGFFVPPASGQYAFLLRGNGPAAVWLSVNASAAAQRTLLLSQSSGATQIAQLWDAAHLSTPLPLVGGKRYYFQAQHVSTSNPHSFSVGVRMVGAGNSSIFSSAAQLALASQPHVVRITLALPAALAGGAPLAGSFALALSSPATASAPGGAPCVTALIDAGASTNVISAALAPCAALVPPFSVATSATVTNATLFLRSFDITFTGGGAGGVALTLSAPLALTPVGAFASVQVVVQGAADPLFLPIPAITFFEAPHSTPLLRVRSNGLLAACPGAYASNGSAAPGTSVACAFVYDAALTPAVAGLSSGSGTLGTVLTLTGTGLSPLSISAPPLVTIGAGANASACTVTSFTSGGITCLVGDLPAGVHPVSVTVPGRGLASGGGVFTFQGTITGVVPTEGSTAGGTLLRVIGAGFFQGAFAGANVVTVGGVACAVVGAAPGEVTCITPARAAAAALPVAVNGATSGVATYSYTAVATPALTALAPTLLSVAVTGRVTLTLALPPLAGGTLPANATFAFGGRPCVLLSALTTYPSPGTARVSCLLIRGPSAAVPAAP